MTSCIRFIRPSRYGAVGSTDDSRLGYGVHQALVQRRIAEWVVNPTEKTVLNPSPKSQRPRHKEPAL